MKSFRYSLLGLATAAGALLLTACQQSNSAPIKDAPPLVKAPALPAIDSELLGATAIELPVAAPFLPAGKTTAKLIGTLKDGSQAQQVAFTPDGTYVVSLDYMGTHLRVWDWRKSEVVSAHKTDRLPVSFAIEPAGKGLWGGDSYGTLRRWPLTGDGQLGEPEVIGKDLGNQMGVAVSPNGCLVATASFDKILALWDAKAGKELARITTDEPLRKCAFSPDGKRLLVGTNTNQLLEYQLASGQGRKVLIMPVKADIDLMCMAFSPDGKRFSTGHTQPWLTIWEGDTLLYKHWLTCPLAAICDVAYTRDNALIAFALGNFEIHLWNPDVAAESGGVAVLKGHEKSIHTLAFSPDGRTLASGDDGGTIHLWSSAE